MTPTPYHVRTEDTPTGVPWLYFNDQPIGEAKGQNAHDVANTHFALGYEWGMRRGIGLMIDAVVGAETGRYPTPAGA